MLQDKILLVLFLLFTTSMLALLSNKLNLSYPIILVLAGLLISVIPGIPAINMDPDIIFLVFLPPLLYSAAWTTSWADFWRYKRPISLLAFGLVIFTATAVAFFSHWLIPDFPIALGFLLGGIISPPDAVAAASVFEGLKVPKRVLTILEGESLVNDASSLIVFRFAILAIFTGQFAFWNAAGSFVMVVVTGIALGLAIGYVVYLIHRYLPTTPSIDTALTLITPYLMYLTAEHLHSSGVLAVVSGGLLLSYRSSDIFSYDSRLQVLNVWAVVTFLFNGIVFILIGLQLPTIVHGIGNYSLLDCIIYAVLISLLAIVIRLFWVFPAAFLPRWLNRKIVSREGPLSWKSVFLTGWSGMRGVVSLASALAVPLTLTNGAAFPHRDLILFITFVVIFFTLVLQGLSLPLLLKVLHLKVDNNDDEQDQQIRLRLANTVLEYLDSNCSDQLAKTPLLQRIKERYERTAEILEKQIAGEENLPEFLTSYPQVLVGVINVRREELKKMLHNREFAEHLIRAKETELDLEEATLRKKTVGS